MRYGAQGDAVLIEPLLHHPRLLRVKDHRVG
jgi:hypothetical protein